MYFLAILGFHGMLNQVQYHDAFVDKKVEGEEEKEGAIGFQGKNNYDKIDNCS